jgi:hypothetical protein
MFGPLTNARNRELKDLTPRELAVFAPVVLMAFWLGVYPNTFLSTIDPAVHNTVTQFHAKYDTEIEEGESPKVMSAPKPAEKPEHPAALPLLKLPLPEGGAE